MVQHTPENMIAVLNEIVRTVRIGPSMRAINANEKNVFSWIRRSKEGDRRLLVRGWPNKNSLPKPFHECVKLAQKMHWRGVGLDAAEDVSAPINASVGHLWNGSERQQWMRSSAQPLPSTRDLGPVPMPTPPWRERERLAAISRRAMLDGFKDAAFENAIAVGDPRIPYGVETMDDRQRRAVRNAWWKLASIADPALLVMAGSEAVACESAPPCVVDQPKPPPVIPVSVPPEPSVPRGYRSIEHAARIAIGVRITTKLKNPNVRFKYQTATARFVREFLPSDDPTLAELQNAYNEIGKREGRPPENIVHARCEMIKSNYEHSTTDAGAEAEVRSHCDLAGRPDAADGIIAWNRWRQNQAAAEWANAQMQVRPLTGAA